MKCIFERTVYRILDRTAQTLAADMGCHRYRVSFRTTSARVEDQRDKRPAIRRSPTDRFSSRWPPSRFRSEARSGGHLNGDRWSEAVVAVHLHPGPRDPRPLGPRLQYRAAALIAWLRHTGSVRCRTRTAMDGADPARCLTRAHARQHRQVSGCRWMKDRGHVSSYRVKGRIPF